MESEKIELLLKGLNTMYDKKLVSTLYLLKGCRERIDKLNFMLNTENVGTIDYQMDGETNELLDYATEIEEELKRGLAAQSRYIRDMEQESRRATALIQTLKRYIEELRHKKELPT